jgi:ubiquitin-small subunit ribosomal protein S27Ae
VAKSKGGSKKDKKGKKPHKNKPTSVKYKHYKIEGDKVSRLKKHCPRCGPGVFLAVHKNRTYCGRCKYTEFKGKEDK